jgi:GGDEF domain-containing protein
MAMMITKVWDGSLWRISRWRSPIASPGWLIVRPMTLLFLDLDGFKQVNDERGHATSDEFVILLTPASGGIKLIARQLAKRTLKAVSLPVRLDVGQAPVQCSIGGAFWPKDGRTPDAVLERADKALYRAKAKGKNVAVFSPEL